MSEKSPPSRQLGNRRQIISHPINCVGWKQEAYLMTTRFPLTSTLSRVSLLDSDMLGGWLVVWFFPVLSFSPGLLRFLRLVSYRMTAVTLMQSGATATRAGSNIPPANNWLQRAEILSFYWLMAVTHCRLVTPFHWLSSMELNSLSLVKALFWIY